MGQNHAGGSSREGPLHDFPWMDARAVDCFADELHQRHERVPCVHEEDTEAFAIPVPEPRRELSPYEPRTALTDEGDNYVRPALVSLLYSPDSRRIPNASAAATSASAASSTNDS